jgi:hypothetical protein
MVTFVSTVCFLSTAAYTLGSAIPLDVRAPAASTAISSANVLKQEAYEQDTVNNAISQFSSTQKKLETIQKNASLNQTLSALSLSTLVQGLFTVGSGMNSALSQTQEALFLESQVVGMWMYELWRAM